MSFGRHNLLVNVKVSVWRLYICSECVVREKRLTWLIRFHCLCSPIVTSSNTSLYISFVIRVKHFGASRFIFSPPPSKHHQIQRVYIWKCHQEELFLWLIVFHFFLRPDLNRRHQIQQPNTSTFHFFPLPQFQPRHQIQQLNINVSSGGTLKTYYDFFFPRSSNTTSLYIRMSPGRNTLWFITSHFFPRSNRNVIKYNNSIYQFVVRGKLSTWLITRIHHQIQVYISVCHEEKLDLIYNASLLSALIKYIKFTHQFVTREEHLTWLIILHVFCGRILTSSYTTT